MSALNVGIISADRTGLHGHAINLGDAFLTDVLAGAIAMRGHNSVAVDFGDERVDGASRRRLAGVGALSRFASEMDAIVVGGGTMLQDDNRSSHFGGLPRLVAVSRVVAAARRTPFGYFGVGCDPVDRPIPKTLLAIGVRSADVWVRDARSLDRVQRSLRGRAYLAADACLLSTGSPLPPAEPIEQVSFAMNFKDVGQLDPETINRISAGRRVALLRMSQGGELDDLPEAARKNIGEFEKSVSGLSTWRDAYRTIAESRMLVASRMHALYMAMLAGTPMIAVGTSAKVAAFADEFGVPRANTLRDVAASDGGTVDPSRLNDAKARAERGLTNLLETLLPA